MVFLYYTGAAEPNQPQTQIQRSLGGYKSSTRIPNASLNSLFQGVGQRQSQEGDEQIIGVILTNESGATITNLSLYATVPVGSNTTFQVAAVTLIDSNRIEQIPNNQSTPYVGELVEMTTLANKRVLSASLANGASIGVWIRRTIPKQTAQTCDQLYDAYKASGLPSEDPTVEIATMVLEWT
jgi:hypothetical protein